MIEADPAVKIVPPQTPRVDDTGAVGVSMNGVRPGEEVSFQGRRWMVTMVYPHPVEPNRAWLEPKSAT